MKCSLGISNFLQEISSPSCFIVFLYFFAFITEEDFLISPWYSLELCKLESAYPMHSKAIYWYQIVVNESTAFIARHPLWSEGRRMLMFRKHELPNGFQRSNFKGKVKENSCRVSDQFIHILGWWEVTQPVVQGSTSTVLCVPSGLGSMWGCLTSS